jgi:hypothetical protein
MACVRKGALGLFEGFAWGDRNLVGEFRSVRGCGVHVERECRGVYTKRSC